jgi:uncharacterized membrane protein
MHMDGYWSEIAYWMIAAGVVTGMLAAPFGTIDWFAIPSGTRAKRIGALSFAAGCLALFPGWLGGELMDRRGVGLDDGAHVDASRSLARRWSGG